MRRLLPALLVLAALGFVVGSAYGHAERYAFFPDHTLGKVPKYRTTGPSLVVCKPDSRTCVCCGAAASSTSRRR
jgi:hypothetical protein